jgi:hypothetical protein
MPFRRKGHYSLRFRNFLPATIFLSPLFSVIYFEYHSTNPFAQDSGVALRPMGFSLQKLFKTKRQGGRERGPSHNITCPIDRPALIHYSAEVLEWETKINTGNNDLIHLVDKLAFPSSLDSGTLDNSDDVILALSEAKLLLQLLTHQVERLITAHDAAHRERQACLSLSDSSNTSNKTGELRKRIPSLPSKVMGNTSSLILQAASNARQPPCDDNSSFLTDEFHEMNRNSYALVLIDPPKFTSLPSRASTLVGETNFIL